MRYTMRLLKISVLILLICLSSLISSSEKVYKGPPYFIGGDLLLNNRSGYYLFEGSKKKEKIERPFLIMGGACLGKRYFINPLFRFELLGHFHIGKEESDTLYFTKKFSYKHFGCDLDIHLVLPSIEKLAPFFLIGGGINYIKHNQDIEILIDLDKDYSREIKNWSPSAQGGIGLDFKLKETIGLSLTYSFRLWKAINYLENRDMPYGIEYHEIFYSHLIQLKFFFDFADTF